MRNIQYIQNTFVSNWSGSSSKFFVRPELHLPTVEPILRIINVLRRASIFYSLRFTCRVSLYPFHVPSAKSYETFHNIQILDSNGFLAPKQTYKLEVRSL